MIPVGPLRQSEASFCFQGEATESRNFSSGCKISRKQRRGSVPSAGYYRQDAKRGNFSTASITASPNLASSPNKIARKGSERSITHLSKRLQLPKSTRMGTSRTKCIDKPAILGNAAAIEQLSRLSKSWHRRQT